MGSPGLTRKPGSTRLASGGRSAMQRLYAYVPDSDTEGDVEPVEPPLLEGDDPGEE